MAEYGYCTTQLVSRSASVLQACAFFFPTVFPKKVYDLIFV